jgi:hypothetical protein
VLQGNESGFRGIVVRVCDSCRGLSECFLIWVESVVVVVIVAGRYVNEHALILRDIGRGVDESSAETMHVCVRDV